jgi:SpoVK/Ycf46/Vps4 family AAA+-type ATPase
LNYGKEFVKKYDNILQKLRNDKKSGLVLFSGVPGSGKTTIVKNLAMNIDKKIIFVPPGTVDIITTPGFLNFMLDHKNSILLIEDAEKVIRSREGEGSNPEGVSNILNLTDGFLGDCLNLFIIATFNTPREKIDKALIRKGRLVAEHHFDELTADQANIILQKIGSKRKADKNMTLAEIYNEEGGMEEKAQEKEKKRIGF